MTSPHTKHRVRLEILCSLVHGNLDHGDDMRQEAKEVKQFQRRELTLAEAKLYRRGTALGVYISQDRGDISAAICQLGPDSSMKFTGKQERT